MGYNEIFGGSAVYPSNQTYKAIDLESSIVLAWPIESVSTNVIVADIMDFTVGTPGGWNVQLPDATGGSTGIAVIMNNLSGSFSFNVTDNGSNQILSLTPGSVWLLYLTDNSTPNGVWETFQYGAQAGSINVAGIAGAGLLALGTSLNQSMPVVSKSADYTIVVDDRASVILWTGAAGTLTLPNAGTAASNWFINVRNSGTADVLVVPPTGTIDGAAFKTFTSGVGSAVVFTDGSNYYTLGYGGAATPGGFDYTTLDCSGSDGINSPITLSGGQLNRISYKCFGILLGNRSVIVPGTPQQYWVDNETTSAGIGGPWTLTFKTQFGGGQTITQPGQAIIYCDGTDMQPSTSGITLPLAVASGGTGAITADAALTNLGATAFGASFFKTASATTGRGLLNAGTVGGNLFQAITASDALTLLAFGTMTGPMTITAILTAGGIRVTDSTTPVQGMYLPAPNHVGFATVSTLAGYFDASQNLVLTHPLAMAQGGTGVTTVLAFANAYGDMGVSASSLVQRDASGDISARLYKMSGVVDNLSVVNVMYDDGDSYIRHMTLAHFRTAFDTGQFDAVAIGYQTFPSGITLQWGNIGVNSTTFANVSFDTPFSTACFSVVITGTTASIAQARDFVDTVTTTGFRLHNSLNALTTFYWMAIGK